MPKTQAVNDSSNLDAEKDIVRTSSLQEPDNQSNNHAEDNSQTQNEQKLDITKNRQKLVKKVLATNLIETTSSSMTNGGFDEATWGKLDVNDWQGVAQDGLYQLTKYTGDLSHVIVPNKADFEKAGKSTNGLQVGISSGTARSLLSNQTQTIAFSKTNNEKVKAVGTDWSHTFSRSVITNFDGSNLDVSGVTNMSNMFAWNQISDLTSLANWDVSNVTDMSYMFWNNQISDLSPLANWNTDKVTDMNSMFNNNSISNLSPLANWDVSNVTDMSFMFNGNQISNLSSLASWKTGNVTDMSYMFYNNQISNLSPLANWNTSNVTDMHWMFAYNQISDLKGLANWNTSKVTAMVNMFDTNQISDLSPLANWKTDNVTNMSYMFEGNQISDLSPLASWNTGNVTDMDNMFNTNQISNLSPLANWNTGKVTDMSCMFENNLDLIDLSPIANWNMSSVTNDKSFFANDTKLDLANINNTPLMQAFLKEPNALSSSNFITNNADLVKATINQDLPNLTNTAKRTIVFNIPNADPTTIVQTINYKAVVKLVQINFDIDNNIKEIIKTYPVKESDWQLDTSKHNDDVIIDGVIRFKPVKIPHVNGYKAYIVPNKLNPTLFTVSFIAVPTENKPATPVEVAPSKPSASTDNSSNSAWTNLKHKVVNTLNQSDSGWTMPNTQPATHTVEVPDDNTINLSDLVIVEPVHAQTRTQIHINKRFKLSKKHITKYLTHRKNATRTFKKYRL